jgi:flagellar basal-body rod protein FlgF
MQGSLYVALSSQIALERRMNTLADNVANANTTGFRATEIKFNEVLADTGADNVSFVNQGEDFLSSQNGGLRTTGSQLDFAIRGDAWFMVETPTGNMLTRDGRFSITQAGELVNIDGYPVLDPGGAPIQLNPAGDPPKAGRDGGLTQDGFRGLARSACSPGGPVAAGYYPPGVRLAWCPPCRRNRSLMTESALDLLQGYIEDSNVNPVMSEMSRLIMVSRAFEKHHGDDQFHRGCVQGSDPHAWQRSVSLMSRTARILDPGSQGTPCRRSSNHERAPGAGHASAGSPCATSPAPEGGYDVSGTVTAGVPRPLRRGGSLASCPDRRVSSAFAMMARDQACRSG